MERTEGDPLHIDVLGPLQVRLNGEAIDVGGPKAQAVLTTLAHHVGEVVALDTLADALWPNDRPQSARNVIQVRVSGLRKAVGPTLSIRTSGSGYMLESGGVTVDASDFERITAAAEACLDDDPSVAVDLVDEALSLWRGEPAAVALDIRPLEGRLAALTERRVRAELTRLDARLRLGDHVRCCLDTETLVSEHPFREDFRARQMLALYRSGRQVEALGVFRATRQLLVEELGVEPGPQLQELHRQILRQDEVLDLDAPTHANSSAATVSLPTDNLRIEPNTFVERPEIDTVIEALGPGRVVTVVGAGGIGKSRCTSAVARRCREGGSFDDGVWIVDLASLPDGSRDIAVSTAAAIGLGQQAGVPLLDTITAYLRERRTLVVLDNCEHVASAAATFADAIATRCPDTALLAASRVRLNLASEIVITLERLPDDAARRLLAARVGEAGAGPFGNEEYDELCAVLDNYPLAIELAAARTRSMGPREIADRLAEQPQLLHSTAATAEGVSPRRHADLATALDWSLGQLSAGTRATLDRATVFVSDFDLDSAEAVLSTAERPAPDIAGDLGELVEHHLVSRDHGHARFRVLEPIRQYLRAALSTIEVESYRQHYEGLTVEIVQGLRGPDETRWWDRLADELPHVREAVRLAIERGDAERLDRLMMQMAVGAIPMSAFTEPGEWALEAFDRLELDPVDVPGIALSAAIHHAHHKQQKQCSALLDQLAAVDDPLVVATAMVARWFNDPGAADWGPSAQAVADASGDLSLAVYSAASGRNPDVARADRYGNPTLQTFARSMYSAYVLTDRHSAEARENKRELYRIALTSNNNATIAGGQGFMAIQHCFDDDPASAAPLAVEMIERFAKCRSPFWIWHGVEMVAVMLAMVRIEPYTSEKLWAGVTESGTIPYSRLTRDPRLPAWVATQLTEDERRQAFAEGSQLDMDAAVREASKAAARMAVGPPP